MAINLTPEQLAAGADLAREQFAKNEPIDLINAERPLLSWLVQHRENAGSGTLTFGEKVTIENGGVGTSYTGADQVPFDSRDTTRILRFPMAEFHDGYFLSETELLNNGINLTDQATRSLPERDVLQVINILRQRRTDLKNSSETSLDNIFHLDGTASNRDPVGLDGLVSTTPTVGTLAGFARATFPWVQNQANIGISTASPGTLIDAMEITLRAASTFGGMTPNAIFGGDAFIDALRNDAKNTVGRQIQVVQLQNQGTTIDPSVTGLFFHGIEVKRDPSFARMDSEFGPFTPTWAKRCYFLNTNAIKLRPVPGRWQVERRPSRLPDRYIHFWAIQSAYYLTVRNPRGTAVLSIA